MRTKIFYIVAAVLLVGFGIGAWKMQHNHSVTGDYVPGQAKTTVLFVSTKGKSDWILGQCFQFNLSNSTYNAKLQFVESRDAMKKILGGEVQPIVWATDNPAIVGRLNDLWSTKNGHPLVDTSDPVATRVYFHSPIVFLTTKEKLKDLTPILGSTSVWDNIAAIGNGSKPAPGGKLTFAMSNPQTASGGLLTIALILTAYCTEHHLSADNVQVAQSPGFVRYLTSIEKNCLVSSQTQPDSIDVTAQFVNDPKMADFVVAQESEAISIAKQNKDFCVIYPNPTINVREGISMVNGPWVTSDQKDGATQMLAYLASKTSIHNGVVKYLRPEESVSTESLDPIIDLYASQGFKENYIETTAPNYKALNEANYAWKTHLGQN
jgi:hypothetical protein